MLQQVEVLKQPSGICPSQRFNYKPFPDLGGQDLEGVYQPTNQVIIDTSVIIPPFFRKEPQDSLLLAIRKFLDDPETQAEIPRGQTGQVIKTLLKPLVPETLSQAQVLADMETCGFEQHPNTTSPDFQPTNDTLIPFPEHYRPYVPDLIGDMFRFLTAYPTVADQWNRCHSRLRAWRRIFEPKYGQPFLDIHQRNKIRGRNVVAAATAGVMQTCAMYLVDDPTNYELIFFLERSGDRILDEVAPDTYNHLSLQDKLERVREVEKITYRVLGVLFQHRDLTAILKEEIGERTLRRCRKNWEVMLSSSRLRNPQPTAAA